MVLPMARPAWPAAARALSLAALALLGPALGPTDAIAAPRTHVVVIEGLRFEPPTLVVRRGDRVIWRNRDLVPHTVTAAGAFDSGSIAPQAAWSHVFARAATLGYVCSFHPMMTATLQVE
jgi:plastocyanin